MPFPSDTKPLSLQMTPLEFAVLIADEEMGSESSNMIMFLSPQGFVWPKSSAQKARPFCHWE